MENKITINGNNYFSEEYYNHKWTEDINSLKENLKKELITDSTDLEVNQLKWIITDCCNVMGLVPFNRDKSIERGDLIYVGGLGDFKLVPNITFDRIGEDYKAEIFKVMETKFSVEFLEKAKKIVKALNYVKDTRNISRPNFYLKYDKQKNEYVQDYPCLIKWENTVFVLAPRIEDD